MLQLGGGGVQVYSSCGQTFLQLGGGGSRCTQVVVRHSCRLGGGPGVLKLWSDILAALGGGGVHVYSSCGQTFLQLGGGGGPGVLKLWSDILDM